MKVKVKVKAREKEKGLAFLHLRCLLNKVGVGIPKKMTLNVGG